uniref:Uncharacterized protein n=1 Tax=Romanomermis culicivorax TaxID=13658 RepID=A0A915JBD1_ROMCU
MEVTDPVGFLDNVKENERPEAVIQGPFDSSDPLDIHDDVKFFQRHRSLKLDVRRLVEALALNFQRSTGYYFALSSESQFVHSYSNG